LDLVHEWFSIIPRFSNICRFGDKPACVKQSTAAK
jgi:hypothetical protein